MPTPYFTGIEINEECIALIFGKSKVIRKYEEDSTYTFEVEFATGEIVPYTNEGVPAWTTLDMQTLFKKSDILKVDTSNINPYYILTIKEIIALREKNLLQLQDFTSTNYVEYGENKELAEEYMFVKKFHLFRAKN